MSAAFKVYTSATTACDQKVGLTAKVAAAISAGRRRASIGQPGRATNSQELPRQQIEQPDSERAPDRRKGVHPPRRVAERQQMRPEPAPQQVERVAGRMREAAQPGCELELAAIAAQQTGREGAQVERERKVSDGTSREEVEKRKRETSNVET